VSSSSQHVFSSPVVLPQVSDEAGIQAAPAHLLLGVVLNFIPAEQKPVVGHVSLAVQQFVSFNASVPPAVAPAFAADMSQNFVAALALQGFEARPPHFVSSASQHAD
jgi:hypothetical protein